MSSLQSVSQATYDTMSDTELVQASQLGDAGAYGVLTTKYWHPICRFLQNCFRVPHHEAQELVQDVFVRAWKAIVSYCTIKGSFKTWIYSIAMNAARDYRRTQKRRRMLLTQHLFEQDVLHTETSSGNADGPPDFERSAVIPQILSVLPECQARAIVFNYIQGLSHMQISEQERIPLGTIKAWIRKGMKRLQSDKAVLKLKLDYSYMSA